jgi:hypothetical protein
MKFTWYDELELGFEPNDDDEARLLEAIADEQGMTIQALFMDWIEDGLNNLDVSRRESMPSTVGELLRARTAARRDCAGHQASGELRYLERLWDEAMAVSPPYSQLNRRLVLEAGAGDLVAEAEQLTRLS